MMRTLTDGIKAVIFDFDGTFYASHGIKRRLMFSCLSSLVYLKGDREFRRMNRGRDFGSSEGFYEEYCRFIGPKAKQWKDNVFMPAMIKVLKRYKARKDTSSVLNVLKSAGIKIVVFSDYNRVEERMEAIGLSRDLVSSVYDSESLGLLKPCPRGLMNISRDLNVDPKEILVVGDRADTDGEGAIKCGMKFIKIGKMENELNEKDITVLSWEQFLSNIIGSND